MMRGTCGAVSPHLGDPGLCEPQFGFPTKPEVETVFLKRVPCPRNDAGEVRM